MVLSGTKKTSSLSSIANQNQGGGNKKAGMPNSVDMNTAWDHVYLNKTSQNLPVLQFTVNPNVRQSRPVGSTVNTYWKLF